MQIYCKQNQDTVFDTESEAEFNMWNIWWALRRFLTNLSWFSVMLLSGFLFYFYYYALVFHFLPLSSSCVFFRSFPHLSFSHLTPPVPDPLLSM